MQEKLAQGFPAPVIARVAPSAPPPQRSRRTTPLLLTAFSISSLSTEDPSLLQEKMERITPVRSTMFGSPGNASIGYEC